MENVTTAPNPILRFSVYTFLNFCTCADIKNKFAYWFLLAILLWQEEHCEMHIIFCTTNQKTCCYYNKT